MAVNRKPAWARKQHGNATRKSYTSFLTLKLGEKGFDDLLQKASIEALRRLKKNTITYVQADVIDTQIRKRLGVTEEDKSVTGVAKTSVNLSTLTSDTAALSLAINQVSHSHPYPSHINTLDGN